MTQRKVQKPIGKILVERKVIKLEELQEVLLAQQGTSMRIGQLLIKKGLATEEDILSGLAEHHGITYQKKIEFDDPENLFSSNPGAFFKKE